MTSAVALPGWSHIRDQTVLIVTMRAIHSNWLKKRKRDTEGEKEREEESAEKRNGIDSQKCLNFFFQSAT